MNIKIPLSMNKSLDVGCGRYKLPGAIGVDCAPILAERYSPEEFVVHDLNTPLPFDDGRFTQVLASHILEHFPDPNVLIRHIHKVMAVGGIFRVYYPIDSPIDPQPWEPNKDCGHRCLMGTFYFEENEFIQKHFDIVKKDVFVNKDVEFKGNHVDMWCAYVEMKKKC